MIHQYKLGDFNIILDVCSGSVHVVDDVAYDIIELFESESKDDIIAKMSEIAVMVFSPPESAEIFLSFVLGGLAIISTPELSISSGSVSISFASPPLKSSRNTLLNSF